MLPAAVRMRRARDFQLAIGAGRRAAGGPVVLHLAVPTAPATTESDAVSRSDGVTVAGQRPLVGLVVNRAVGNSVVRHRVARRLRHVLRTRICSLPEGGRLVVRALPAAAKADSTSLGAGVDRALAKLMAGGARS